jgi:hypothetical protein
MHGRKSRGDESPPGICSWGTLIQVVPPDFCHFSTFQALAMDSSPPPRRFQPRSTPLFLWHLAVLLNANYYKGQEYWGPMIVVGSIENLR